MNLLALAIAPGIAICVYIYMKDKFNREPIWLLLLMFVLGLFSTIPAIIVQMASGITLQNLEGKPYQNVAFFAFLIVALSEELSKFVMLRLFAYPRKAFDDPFDGITYAVMVGMGFATLENIGYVLDNGIGTGIVRMFISVPAHGTFAVLMGYHIGLAKFEPAKRRWHMLQAIFWPVLFHGFFDFFLFINNSLLHVAGALLSFYIAIRLSRKAIKSHQVYSEQHFKKLPTDVTD